MSDVATAVRTVRTLCFLNEMGDLTLGWDAENDAWVVPMIQKKMDEGYTFWIVKRAPTREVRMRNVSEAVAAGRQIIARDADARILLEQGRIGIIDTPVAARQEETETVRRAHTAAEVASNDTVAHRAQRGG